MNELQHSSPTEELTRLLSWILLEGRKRGKETKIEEKEKVEETIAASSSLQLFEQGPKCPNYYYSVYGASLNFHKALASGVCGGPQPDVEDTLDGT